MNQYTPIVSMSTVRPVKDRDWRLQAEIEENLWRRAEIARFTARWPELQPGPTAPAFSWSSLERQLADLATRPEVREIVPGLVEGTRKQAAGKPPEMVLREILCIASAVMDESFQACAQEDDEMI